LPRGHAALSYVDVGVGFADRAAVVVAESNLILPAHDDDDLTTT